ncbi:GlsB/YeaQ/YmgE family stress response membrane protein [bacterium]|nr:GlsB/YeaQ/YmgE family stress response membrane protein [bacterium]QQR58115.1 MAG: GlsB/YeaQ/YmgE family stress response membrane protein [Candidatus Melainabacteria bacterium]
MTILHFLLYCLVAAICAKIADYFAPGSMPGGLLTAIIFGIIGAWLGGLVMGSLGPDLAGVSLLPAILGSALLIFCLSLFGRFSAKAAP